MEGRVLGGRGSGGPVEATICAADWILEPGGGGTDPGINARAARERAGSQPGTSETQAARTAAHSQ